MAKKTDWTMIFWELIFDILRPMTSYKDVYTFIIEKLGIFSLIVSQHFK